MNHCIQAIFRSQEDIFLYPGGGCSFLWEVASVHWRMFSTVGIPSVLWRLSIRVEGCYQYCGGIPSVLRRVFSTMEEYN